MIIRDKSQEEEYIEAGKISMKILKSMGNMAKEDTTPLEIDEYAGNLCKKYGVKPAFVGVQSQRSVYRHNSCISVNDEVVHGIPSRDRKLRKGDVVKIDFGIIYNGLHTDHCFTFGVSQLSAEDERLVRTARIAVETAVSKAVVGNTTGDLGNTMQSVSKVAGFDVLKHFIGHGIGRSLHEKPEIPAFGIPGGGTHLEEGMVICIECQVVAGSDQYITEENGWTVRTKDGLKAAMFEYMVIVKKKKPKVLTPMYDWKIINA